MIQFAHYKDEMYLEAQKAFGVSPDRHYRLLHVAVEEKPKVVVLSVVVLEADGLEAKDANGELFFQFNFQVLLFFLLSVSIDSCVYVLFLCLLFVFKRKLNTLIQCDLSYTCRRTPQQSITQKT